MPLGQSNTIGPETCPFVDIVLTILPQCLLCCLECFCDDAMAIFVVRTNLPVLYLRNLACLLCLAQLISVLTNTSQLAQRIPGQPGRRSTGCVHRLAGQEWTCWSGDFPTDKKPVTVASGRPCNTYWSAPWWTLPALPMTWQWLMASPLAVPGIGRARFDEHTTPDGRTRMMMSSTNARISMLTTYSYL